ncbi:MAG: VCBS repeat-containing protein [Phycisphaerae bacterium]|nr:VCBS repeat-containing protein [Saprospiraceae bacterium]
MKKLRILLLSTAMTVSLSAQISFTNKTRLLTPVEHYSGVAIAITDMNGDGLNDIVRLSQGTGLNIQFQTEPGKSFSTSIITPVDNAWGMCAADVNNDGLGDVLAGGFYDGVKIVKSNSNGTFSTQNITLPQTFVQGVNFADINNDGWLDAFVCHDDSTSRIFGNNGNGTFTYQPTWIDMTGSYSGNYGSVWSDVNNDGYLDLYVAHCREGMNNTFDPPRINELFLNNGDYTYKRDLANESGLRIGAQSWTADFGDIDNDGDFDCFITNHDVNSQLLENDGAGHFTDITLAAGFVSEIQGLPIQGVFRDFDNDGFTDIIVAGEKHYIFHNNGDKTFSAIANPFDAKEIESFAIGDLNDDGFQDVYAGYAYIYNQISCTNADVLWINNGNDNHFYGLNLHGQQSNLNGVGAKIRLYSSLGIQTREVRSGESYGISNSLQIHFGLGQVTQIDSVVVNWPSGVRDVIYHPEMDQYATLHEGGCIISPTSMIPDGPTVFCTGQSVGLSISDTFSNYHWSTGNTTANITATTQGLYYVTVTNTEGCTVVAGPINVVVDPVQIPLIHALSDSIFCEGDEVVLVSSEAASYLWNTGETTQSIAVSQSGNFTVSVQGLCSPFNAAPYHVQMLGSVLPTAIPDTVEMGESATLIATGDQIAWYSSLNTPAILSLNDTLLTPPLDTTTTYWVTNTLTYNIPKEFVGMVNHEGGVSSENGYNGGLIFDCFKAFILEKTKVYASVAGNRKIELLNSNGDVLQSKIVNIPTGTSIITLNFDVPVGTDLSLTTNKAFNQTNVGSAGPKLRRSNDGCSFPYEIPTVVKIKISSADCEHYYYFYNWQVGFHDYECESDRVPVTAVVKEPSSTAPLPAWAAGLSIFPNPTEGTVHLDIQDFAGGDLSAAVKNAQGQTLQVRTFNAPAGNASFSTDLGLLPAGIYWLELAGKDGVAQRKVVIH